MLGFWQQRGSVAPVPPVTCGPALRPARLPLQFYGTPASGTSDSFSRSFGVKCYSLFVCLLSDLRLIQNHISRRCNEHSQFVNKTARLCLDQSVFLTVAVAVAAAAVQTLKKTAQ